MCSVHLTAPGSNKKETESFTLLWQFYTEVKDPELLETKTEKDSSKQNTVPLYLLFNAFFFFPIRLDLQRLKVKLSLPN